MPTWRQFRAAVVALLGVLISGAAVDAAQGKLTVTWLDMAYHGLAVVVETPGGKVFVIDTGGTKQSGTENYNAGRDTVAPFLTARGYKEIAGITISHPHGDHYGGAGWLLENWKVREFVDNGYEGRGQTDAYKQLRSVADQRGGVYLLQQRQAAERAALQATA